MKRAIVWIHAGGFALVSVICLLAAFGELSNDKPRPGQNQLGGYGEISFTGNPEQHYYYDDTTFYYLALAPSWDVHGFYELYAYDLATGKSYSVCKHISCNHKSAACPIHRLYQNDYGSTTGYWNLIDHEFVAPHYTKDEMPVICWEPLTNAVRTVAKPPRYSGVSDSEFVGKYQTFFNQAMRLTDDLVVIGYNNEMHVCDNEYQEKFSFSAVGLKYPMVVGNKLYWIGPYTDDLRMLNLETQEIEKNLLNGLFHTKKVVSLQEVGWPFAAFSYQYNIYFPRKEKIYAFDTEARSVTEIAQFDKLTDEEPYACFGTENLIYYKWQGMVRCMNLDTGAVTDLPEMPKVPCAAVHDYLLFIRTETTGADDIECYDRSGKTVHS